MMKTPFYRKGLKFSCVRCSACCRYESGFVFLSQADLCALAEAFHISAEDFISVYCRWIPQGAGFEELSLKERLVDKGNFDCIFWKEGCSVYENRPVQCRTFPFWDFMLEDEESWNRNAEQCPGMGKGILHSFDEIQARLKERQSQRVIRRRKNERTVFVE